MFFNEKAKKKLFISTVLFEFGRCSITVSASTKTKIYKRRKSKTIPENGIGRDFSHRGHIENKTTT